MQGTLHTAKELQLLKAKAAREAAARKSNQPHESPDRLEKQTGRLIAVDERAARAAKAAELRASVNKGQVSSIMPVLMLMPMPMLMLMLMLMLMPMLMPMPMPMPMPH